MKIQDSVKNDILILTILEDRMDARIAVEFRDTINGYIEDQNYKIVLNLSQVQFIDSSGLGAIVSSLKTLGRQGDMVLCHLSEAVKNMFKLTRMDKVFNIYSTEKDATDALS